MKLIQLTDYWRAFNNHGFSWNLILLLQKNFDMAKIIGGFLETLFEYYFLNIIVNDDEFWYGKKY